MANKKISELAELETSVDADLIAVVDVAGSETKKQTKLNFLKEAIAGALPSGLIAMWKGTIATIPAGWVLCNGSNGTPDLRNRFIVGAQQDDNGIAKTNITGALTQVGGAITHTHSLEGLTTEAANPHTHEFTTGLGGEDQTSDSAISFEVESAESGEHTHYFTGLTEGVGDHYHSIGTGPSIGEGESFLASTDPAGAHNHNFDGTTASDGAHRHNVIGNQVGEHSHSQPAHTHTGTTQEDGGPHTHDIIAELGIGPNLPPYYALAFIMKT